MTTTTARLTTAAAKLDTLFPHLADAPAPRPHRPATDSIRAAMERRGLRTGCGMTDTATTDAQPQGLVTVRYSEQDDIWTVGQWQDGVWVPLSDHATEFEADDAACALCGE